MSEYRWNEKNNTFTWSNSNKNNNNTFSLLYNPFKDVSTLYLLDTWSIIFDVSN